MKVELINYKDQRVEVELPEKKDILCAVITILSGDETLDILTKDGRNLHFDSDKNGRWQDFYDGTYSVYAEGMIDLFADPTWLNRKDSGWV